MSTMVQLASLTFAALNCLMIPDCWYFENGTSYMDWYVATRGHAEIGNLRQHHFRKGKLAISVTCSIKRCAFFAT